VIAPDQSNSEFNGKIKVENLENSSDYETMQVTLNTPREKIHSNFLFIKTLLKNSNFFSFIKYILIILDLV
jgi:hypothetical protein